MATALLAGPNLCAQGLQDLSFGTGSTFEVLTWNIEWFPKSGQTTLDKVGQVIEALDVDLLALQEIDQPSKLQEVVDGLPGYEAYYQSSWYAGLAYVYKVDTVQILQTYEIYTTQPYWSAFPRSPLVMELEYNGERLVVINNHFKCCGDGVLDLSDPDDEELRRFTASNLLRQYVDTNLPLENVIVLGDLNDELTDSPVNNVFQGFLDDPAGYLFADSSIASGSSSDWSYPSWPSHLDHILITNELFDEFGSSGADIQTIRIDDYLPGGWAEYDASISDHRPVALKIPLGGTGVGCQTAAFASQTIRLGTPANPLALLPGLSSAPIVGATWDPVILHATFLPAALVDVLLITANPANLPTGFGTLLCDLTTAPIVYSQAAGASFSLPIPASCNLVGKTLTVQGASADATGVALTNALDCTVGTY